MIFVILLLELRPFIFVGKNRGKRVYTTTVASLFVAGPRGHRAIKLWCMPLPWENKGKALKGIHHRSGGVYFFSSLKNTQTNPRGAFPALVSNVHYIKFCGINSYS